MEPRPANEPGEPEDLQDPAKVSRALQDSLTRDDMRSPMSKSLIWDGTLDEASRLKALSADVRDQDELERNIGRQVRFPAHYRSEEKFADSPLI